MSTREDLAEVINNGVGTWRTPLEAADAILGALAPCAALDAVLALHQPNKGHNPNCGCGIQPGANKRCCGCYEAWPCPTVADINDALEAGK